MASATEESESTLNQIFEDACVRFEKIEASTESQKDAQGEIKRSIALLENATRLINLVGVFSPNETIDEVATANIRYLAIPAMLGILVDKLEIDRVEALDMCEVYLKDFVERLKSYGVLEESFKVEQKAGGDLKQLAEQRNEKIRRYQEQKQLEQEKEQLKKALQNADEEIQRKYYLIFVKSFVSKAVDLLNSIAMEKPLAKMIKEGVKIEKEEKKPITPLKPIIITRNELQKKVFGAGYPSLATMTVDEFYEQRVKEGVFPADGSKYGKSLQELADPEIAKREEEKKEKEKEDEEDDEAALQRAREMDEFKDEHRRGWGNRYNRS